MRDDLSADLMMLVVDDFLMFYRLVDGVVVISRVLYGARDLQEVRYPEE